jgi:hypothetical protein
MFVAGSRPLRTHEGRSGIPGCSSGRMPKTVTVPPVTVVVIRARKVPDTLPTRYSVVAFAGTAIVVNAVQTIAPADPDPGDTGVVCGQHSIATAPGVTLPLPWTLKVRKRTVKEQKRPWYGQHTVNDLEFFSCVILACAWLAWVCQLCVQEATEETRRGKRARTASTQVSREIGPPNRSRSYAVNGGSS